MKPNWLNDVGIPVVVGGADIGLSYWDEKRLAVTPTATRFQPFLGIVGAVGGIGLMMANMWADQAQVVAHATIPMATKTLYDWIKSYMAPATSRSYPMSRPMAVPVSGIRNYPAPSSKPEFAKAPAD